MTIVVSRYEAALISRIEEPAIAVTNASVSGSLNSSAIRAELSITISRSDRVRYSPVFPRECGCRGPAVARLRPGWRGRAQAVHRHLTASPDRLNRQVRSRHHARLQEAPEHDRSAFRPVRHGCVSLPSSLVILPGTS